MPQQAAGRFEPGAPSSGLHDGWRILRRPRKAAALKLRRRQGRESRPRCRIKRGYFILWPPARRHPGRPTAASAAGGEMHPAPSAWCALAEGSMWAERPGLLRGFPVRHPGSMGTNTTRICSPGKFEQRRPGPRAPHPFRCAGMGVGCAAGGPLRRFNPGGPQL